MCILVYNYTLQATAKADLEQLCDLLPGNIKTECTALVENNFDKIWEGIEKEVVSTSNIYTHTHTLTHSLTHLLTQDSGKLCQEIDLCPKTALPIPMVKEAIPFNIYT